MVEHFWQDIKDILETVSLKNYDDELNDFKCGICGKIIVNAAQIICGCRFCRFCIENYVLNGGRMCPNRESDDCCALILKGIKDIHDERVSNEKILNFQVNCPLEGCSYETELANMVSHWKNCKKKDFGNLSFHSSGVYNNCNESVQCEGDTFYSVKETNDDNFITANHSNKSKNVKFDESETIEDLKMAINTLKRKNIKLKKCLEEMNDRIIELEKNQNNSQLNTSLLFKTVNCLEEQLEENKYNSFIWKVKDLSKIRTNKNLIYSKPFYIFKNGYKMRLLLYPGGCYNILFLSVYFEIMRSDHDLLLQWPFCYNVTFTLLNQKGDKSHRHMVCYVHHKNRAYVYGRPTKSFNTGLGFNDFIEYYRLEPEGFVIDDSIILICSVSKSPPSLTYVD